LAWSFLIAPISLCAKVAAKFIAILSELTALIALLVDVIPAAVTLFTFHGDAFRRLRDEVEHDYGLARKLVPFGKDVLCETREWLDVIIARRKARIGIFMGGADKVALTALAAMGWSALKELAADQHTWQFYAFMPGAALICGFALGGAFLNFVIHRYEYQCDLIALALKRIANDASE
jgi:hypothetical protein